MSLRSESRVAISVAISALKRCWFRVCLQLFVEGLRSCLRYVCLFVYSGVQHIFINDIFYFISDRSLYNYADDNTLSYSDYDLDKIINTMEKDSLNLIEWFTSNQVQAYPDKFQAIAICKNT